MENLVESLIKYFEKTNKSFTINELRKKFNIKGEEQTDIFCGALNALVENGGLFFDGKTYKLFTPNLGYAYGEIEINKSGNGFIHTKYGTIFIEREKLNGALNGDKVIIGNIDFGRKQDYKGEVTKILKRKNGKLIFKVENVENNIELIPYNKFQNIDIVVNKNELRNLKPGDYVVVKVTTEKNADNKFYAEIEKNIGTEDSKNIDVKILFEEYDIPVEFSKEIEEEVKQLPTKVEEKDLIGRTDLRNIPIITIDCDDTKDRDDAVYVEKLQNGNYKLIVSIADVSHYIKRGSKSFEEALIRNTSHYVNNTCNPMFHPIISNGICSLNENVDRLTKTCEMEINPDGEVIDVKIYKSVINSKKAMKYSEVNKVLNGEKIQGYEWFIGQLKLMEELNNILEVARQKRNYIDFGVSNIDIVENNIGKAIDFKMAETGTSQQIIENFMVTTNESVAKHFYWIPFIFRVHEPPNQLIVKNVLDKLRSAGYKIPKIKNINEQALKSILQQLTKIDCLDIAKSEILKSMKRARYSTENEKHFALQLDSYCHFTSPIRRIADFMIHTIIDEMDTFDYSKESIDSLEKELQIVCENASRLERISKEIEDKGRMTLMAEYMEEHIGDVFEAYITEVYQHGMFAKTKNLIPGKIKLEDIPGDKYYYDFEKNTIIGKKNKKKFAIGQKVYVIVKDASKTNRTVSFEISKQKTKKLGIA